MNQTTSSILRAILMVAGALLVGHHIWSTQIDPTVWDTISGVVVSLVSLGWGIATKTTNLEAFEASIKGALVFVGGLLVASGKLSVEKMNTWMGVAGVILPVIWSWVSKNK